MENESKQAILDILAKHTLTLNFKHIPTRYTKDEDGRGPWLKFSVDVLHRGTAILTTTYSMGIGNVPSYMRAVNHLGCELYLPLNIIGEAEVAVELRTGKSTYKILDNGKLSTPVKPYNLQPDELDVWYSLILDGEADSMTFETWCDNYGYDSDSRKAEATYNQCVAIGKTLRLAIGSEELEKLRVAFYDY
jgi:hypothetical protein